MATAQQTTPDLQQRPCGGEVGRRECRHCRVWDQQTQGHECAEQKPGDRNGGSSKRCEV